MDEAPTKSDVNMEERPEDEEVKEKAEDARDQAYEEAPDIEPELSDSEICGLDGIAELPDLEHSKAAVKVPTGQPELENDGRVKTKAKRVGVRRKD